MNTRKQNFDNEERSCLQFHKKSSRKKLIVATKLTKR